MCVVCWMRKDDGTLGVVFQRLRQDRYGLGLYDNDLLKVVSPVFLHPGPFALFPSRREGCFSPAILGNRFGYFSFHHALN